MDLAVKIRLLREALGLSIRDLAGRTGLNRDTLWKVETGQTRPRGTTLHKIARALRIDYHSLVDRDVDLESLREHLQRRSPGEPPDWPPPEALGKEGVDWAQPVGGGRAVPVFPVGADDDKDWGDGEFPVGVSDEYWPAIPGLDDEHAFYCKVFGDSMEPILHEGDLVYFTPSRASWRDGDICLIRTHEWACLKRVFAAGGSKVRLVPENRAYSERTVDLQTEVVQLHPVVATTRIMSQNGQ